MRKEELKKAKLLLEHDELVAIPTETVYGLAANAYSDNAINKIYALKNRPASNPLIVHISNASKLENIAQNIPEVAFKLVEKYWPGPITLVLEKQEHISSLITAGLNSVAVRVPNHSLTLELLNSVNFPLVAPSANRSNHISPTHPEHVKLSFGYKAPFILNGGQCAKGIESTIIGFEDSVPKIYRQGAIGQDEIEEFLRLKVISTSSNQPIVAPGMSHKHYSPNTDFILSDNIELAAKKFEGKNIGLLLAQPHKTIEANFPHKILSRNGSLNEMMNNLYSYMYALDQLNLDIIIAEKVVNDGVGIAINDKLARASNQQY